MAWQTSDAGHEHGTTIWSHSDAATRHYPSSTWHIVAARAQRTGNGVHRRARLEELGRERNVVYTVHPFVDPFGDPRSNSAFDGLREAIPADAGAHPPSDTPLDGYTGLGPVGHGVGASTTDSPIPSGFGAAPASSGASASGDSAPTTGGRRGRTGDGGSASGRNGAINADGHAEPGQASPRDHGRSSAENRSDGTGDGNGRGHRRGNGTGTTGHGSTHGTSASGGHSRGASHGQGHHGAPHGSADGVPGVAGSAPARRGSDAEAHPDAIDPNLCFRRRRGKPFSARYDSPGRRSQRWARWARDRRNELPACRQRRRHQEWEQLPHLRMAPGRAGSGRASGGAGMAVRPPEGHEHLLTSLIDLPTGQVTRIWSSVCGSS